jgi:hypothetical protein
MDRINVLANEMKAYVPLSTVGAEDFRADLAGLLVVTIVASYESCIKDTLISYASKQNQRFSEYVERRYSKLNSKIAINDLCRYCKDFDPNAHNSFNDRRRATKEKINSALGQDIEKAYQQLLDWRHDFAHKARRNTTIEEAFSFHRYSKHVVYTFYDAFHR